KTHSYAQTLPRAHIREDREDEQQEKEKIPHDPREHLDVGFLLLCPGLLHQVLPYVGSWEGLGIGIGLLSASLGFALQRPITGIAAWVMLIVNKPFIIGDRIIIGTTRGDVVNITLSHVYLMEIGGIVTGEETSGRIIMIPNSVLFEQNIINYTSQDDYILDQVVVAITYESNLDGAMKITLDSARKHTKEFIEATGKKPYVRTFFQSSGIDVHVRYTSPATRLQEFSSAITKEIYDRIMKADDVEIAYPHTEVVLRKKKSE
ncbi:MAG: mechanosensitive ion channel family protein, partial [Candidatus Altiarchaeota archaeon]|nr:mechanosensitive ion channel family protein [Candidatus Altiarchaeota archaeon]